ncbi:FecR family protein [Chitinophaga sp.]|uniref:FecR family protein n=1 Tax=Chitinophaga sp. TaxID=1869181 RepID=UPI002625F9AC|nr:FecR family protein [uncultured Chitinophaga sp.]
MDKLELIKQFLDNACTGEEAARVEEILASEPELADTLLPQEEWEQPASANPHTGTRLQQEIWAGVAAATRQTARRRTLYTTLAAAASILILIATGMYFLRQPAAAPDHTHAIVAGNPAQAIINTTGRDSTFTLPDGSSVTMKPQASLLYPADFRANRTIRLLSGKAIFDVTADAAHPFVVISGNISTTALGTRFLVDHSGPKVNVQLYEGKVAVKYLGKQVQVYPTVLQPGEQCFVNTQLDGITVAPVPARQLRSEAGIAGPTAAAGKASLLTFNNVPLNDAFDVLGELFHQPIRYHLADVEKMYFTGQFHAADSLSDILHILSSVNGLSVTQHADTLLITRPAAESGKAIPEEDGATGKVSVTKFTNTPLAEVFRAMESTFAISIGYNPQEVAHKYFTGNVSSRDDANTILTIICRTNQLQLTRNGDKFQITHNRQTNK